MTEWWREPQDEPGLVSPVTGLPYPPPPGVSPFPPPGTGLGGTPPVTPRPYAPPIGNEPMVVPPVGAQPRAPHNHPAWQPAPTPFGLPTPPAYADPGGSPVATYGVPWVIPRTEPLPWQMGPERIGLQPVVGAPPPRETVREQPPAPEPEVPRAPMGDMPGMGIGMALAQGQTLPLTAQRIRDTWERVGAPIEAYQLPWALRAGQQDRYQMGPERMGLPSDQRFPSVAEMMAPPAMLAGAEAGDLGQAGARALGLVGAAVHDVQQVPVLARPARAVGAAVGTLANVVQAPAYVAEEAAALPIQWSGAGAVFPSLGPGKVLTPGQAAEVERRVAETGRWRWAVQQEVLAEAYADAPSLRDYAHQKWGRTPEVDQALARLGLMAWSSYPAQLGGLHRLMEGEPLDSVINGHQVPRGRESADDVARVEAYVRGVRAAFGDEAARDAVEQVLQTGMVPPAIDLGNELVGQFVADPLQIVDYLTWGRALSAQVAKATGRIGAAAPEAAAAMRAADALAGNVQVMRAADLSGLPPQVVATWLDEIGRAEKQASQAASYAHAVLRGGVDGGPATPPGGWQALWQKVNPFELTPEAKQAKLTNTAYQVAAPIGWTVDNGAEARAMVEALATDPQRLVPVLGEVPVSVAAIEAAPVWDEVVAQLDEFASLRNPKWDPGRFMAELDEAVFKAAGAIYDVSDEGATGYRRFANRYRATMSQAYMTFNPGYHMRNAVGDAGTMVWDGVFTLDGRQQIDAFLDHVGPTTRRVAGEGASQISQAEGGWLGGVTQRIQEWGKANEEGRYTRAFYRAYQRAWPEAWRPRVPDELRNVLGEGLAADLERGLAARYTQDEMTRVIRGLAGDQDVWVDVYRYVDPDALSPALVARVEDGLNQATSVDQIDGVIDEALEEVRQTAARAYAVDPTPPGRRTWGRFEFAQDVAEEEGWAATAAEATGLGADEIARQAEEYRQVMAEGHAAIRAKAEALAAAAGGEYDADSGQLLRYYTSQVEMNRMQTRARVDKLRAETLEQLQGVQDQAQRGALWQTYFGQRTEWWRETNQQGLSLLDQATGALGRLNAGEPLQQIVGQPLDDVVRQGLDQWRSLVREVGARRRRWERAGLDSMEGFENMLEARRLAMDTAGLELWRRVAMNPGQDALEIAMDAQMRVWEMGSATSMRVDNARQAWIMGASGKGRGARDDFYALADRLWTEFFTDAPQVLMLATGEVGELAMTPGAMGRALESMGWPADEVVKLTDLQRQSVLAAGVRWDPLLNAPELPIEEALQGSIHWVAEQAGLDVAKMADWEPSQWETLQIQAGMLRKDMADRASAAARWRATAYERAAEAAQMAPRTVRSGMELQWPRNVDDLARSRGLEPQRMEADDWYELAEWAHGEGRERWTMHTQAGREGMAAEEAMRLPSHYQQVGKEQIMVRAGRLSRRQEAEVARELKWTARGIDEQTVEWLLKQAGWTAEDLEPLTFQQMQRLTEELANGKILLTKSGNISQIGGLSREKRLQALMQGRSNGDELRRIAQDLGMVTEPGEAVAYRMMQLAEDAQARADALAGVQRVAADVADPLRQYADQLGTTEAELRTAAEALGMDPAEFARAEVAARGGQQVAEAVPGIPAVDMRFSQFVEPASLSDLARAAENVEPETMTRGDWANMATWVWDQGERATGVPFYAWRLADANPPVRTVERLVETFGVTDDPLEAFWVLPDGRMLNRAAREGYIGNLSHWDVQDALDLSAYDLGPGRRLGASGVVQFMQYQTGAVRVAIVLPHQTGWTGLHINPGAWHAITEAQERTLTRMLEKARRMMRDEMRIVYDVEKLPMTESVQGIIENARLADLEQMLDVQRQAVQDWARPVDAPELAQSWLQFYDEAKQLGRSGGTEVPGFAVSPAARYAEGRPLKQVAQPQVAQPQRPIINPPGQYTADGWPVFRAPKERATGVGIAAAVDEMVPAAQRRGVGQASVGFEEHMGWLAGQYEDIEQLARNQVELLRSGATYGESIPVPGSVVRTKTRRDGQLYFLDLLRQDGEAERTFYFYSYQEARRAKRRVDEIIAAGLQGQGHATASRPIGLSTADVAQVDSMAAAQGGYFGAPTLSDIARVVEAQETNALNRIREGVASDWGRLGTNAYGEAGASPGLGGSAGLGGAAARISPDQARVLLMWAEEQLGPQLNQARAAATEGARLAADETLLDYSKRMRLDQWLNLVFPYSFWYTRSARNWALRGVRRPGMAAKFTRLLDYREKRNQERGARERFEGKLAIPAGQVLPDWMGDEIYVDPLRMGLAPFQLLPNTWGEDPNEARNPLEFMWRWAERFGMRPYGFLEWPLKYAGLVGDREELGYLLPQTGVIEAATAGLRELSPGMAERIPPGGVSIERAARRAIGVPEQEPFGAYRTGRAVENLAAEDPQRWEAGLVAQELQRRVQMQEITLAEATNPSSPSARRLGLELGWAPELLAAGQEMLAQGLQRAALERGVGGLSSFLTGAPATVYPAGEQRQIELQRQARAQGYSQLEAGIPPEIRQPGSREALQAFQAQHPEMLTRSGAGALIDPTRYAGMTPEALRQMERGRRDRTAETQLRDAYVDAAIRREPWNAAGARAAGEAAVPSGPPVLGQEAEAPRLWSTYGANPQEVARIRREQLLSVASGAMPHMADFETADGEVDYDAYEAAVAQFYADPRAALGSDPTVALIARDLGVGVDALLAGLSQEEVETYWRRGDTALEALQRVWQDNIYGGAWERYHEAVSGLTGPGSEGLEAGEAKGRAWDAHMETPGVAGADLIGQVMREYPGRWTREELQRAYEGVTFPSPAEVVQLRKPPAERALSEAQETFWQFYNESLPPGRLSAEARAIPLVQTLLDAETRGMATAEQYLAAQERLAMWVGRNQDPETWGTPEEWAQARAENERFYDLRDARWPEIGNVQDRYFAQPQERRDDYLAQHPELEEYWDFRRWYAQEYPVWGRYYGPEGATGGGGFAEASGEIHREWHTPEYIAQAMQENTAFRALVEEEFATEGGYRAIMQIQSGYYEMPKNWRPAYLRAFPELQRYWDLRKEYAVQFPIWGYWYTGAGKYLRDTYFPQRKRGGGGGRVRAGWPGKWTLDAPSAWRGALSGREDAYRAQGLPWVMDKPGYRNVKPANAYWIPRQNR